MFSLEDDQHFDVEDGLRTSRAFFATRQHTCVAVCKKAKPDGGEDVRKGWTSVFSSPMSIAEPPGYRQCAGKHGIRLTIHELEDIYIGEKKPRRCPPPHVFVRESWGAPEGAEIFVRDADGEELLRPLAADVVAVAGVSSYARSQGVDDMPMDAHQTSGALPVLRIPSAGVDSDLAGIWCSERVVRGDEGG